MVRLVFVYHEFHHRRTQLNKPAQVFTVCLNMISGLGALSIKTYAGNFSLSCLPLITEYRTTADIDRPQLAY